MALSDSFRKVPVYFGLAEDREYYDDDEPEIQERDREPERELESRYQERPNVRRLSSRRRRDEIDDIFGDDSPSERRTTQLRTVGGDRARTANGRGEVRVHLVVPKSFNDAQDVADKFKDAIPVIVNLQSSDPELSKRLSTSCPASPTRSTAACSGSPTRCSCSRRATSRSRRRSARR